VEIKKYDEEEEEEERHFLALFASLCEIAPTL